VRINNNINTNHRSSFISDTIQTHFIFVQHVLDMISAIESSKERLKSVLNKGLVKRNSDKKAQGDPAGAQESTRRSSRSTRKHKEIQLDHKKAQGDPAGAQENTRRSSWTTRKHKEIQLDHKKAQGDPAGPQERTRRSSWTTRKHKEIQLEHTTQQHDCQMNQCAGLHNSSHCHN
jgi:hypothetical protein